MTAAVPFERYSDLVALRPFRHRMYALLASAFAQPPTSEVLEALRSPEFRNSMAELFGEESVRDLEGGHREDRDAGGLIEALQQEFMDLFRVPGAKYVTPYESVYRDTREIGGQPVKGLLMGPSAADVKHWYRLARLQISDEYEDLPDHIALELIFLAELCTREVELDAAGDQPRMVRALEMQRDFLAGHVVRWIGALAECIGRLAEQPFYRGLGRISAAFARRDLATLEELLGPSAGASRPDYPRVGE